MEGWNAAKLHTQKAAHGRQLSRGRNHNPETNHFFASATLIHDQSGLALINKVNHRDSLKLHFPALHFQLFLLQTTTATNYHFHQQQLQTRLYRRVSSIETTSQQPQHDWT